MQNIRNMERMVKLMRTSVPVCVAMAVFLVAPAVVPEAAAQGLAPDYYGTADANYHYVSAEEFQSNHSDGYLQFQHGFWRCASFGLNVVAAMRLPSGALVDGYTVIFDDSSADGDISVWLSRHWVSALGTAGTTQIGPTFQSSGDPGITSSWVDLDPDLTISYYNAFTLATQSYVLTAAIECRDDLSFRGVIVRWNRQVSPAPATATFNDVPTGYWAFQFIEALADSGITAGCGGGSFCPDNTLTRAEMAVFLSKALGLHYSP